jgi:hypothetical protein
MFHAFDVVGGQSAQPTFARYVDPMIAAFVMYGFHRERVLAK